jgi:hypothetical protein
MYSWWAQTLIDSPLTSLALHTEDNYLTNSIVKIRLELHMQIIQYIMNYEPAYL